MLYHFSYFFIFIVFKRESERERDRERDREREREKEREKERERERERKGERKKEKNILCNSVYQYDSIRVKLATRATIQ